MSVRSNIAARWISNIMNPFPITLLLLLAVSYTSSGSLQVFAVWAAIILFCFFAVPFTYIYVKNILSRHRKMEFQEPTAFFRQHRKGIWVLGITAMAIFIPALIFLEAPSGLYATFAALVGTNMAIAIVNKYFKASFHLAVITAVVIIITLTWGEKALPVIAIIPIIGWARYSLGQHSPPQLATGFGLATIITFPILYYFNHSIVIPV